MTNRTDLLERWDQERIAARSARQGGDVESEWQHLERAHILVRSNQTVDILLDVSNPGQWMAHCHIAEHNQSGMMFSFPVTEER